VPLTHERVHILRTSRWSDAYYARLWGVRPTTVSFARRGLSWRDHPTPPDTAPRVSGGRYCGVRAYSITRNQEELSAIT